MAYNPDIPTATDLISQSQSKILANFTALNAVFQQDHLAFNAAINAGEHLQTTLNNVVADPVLGTLAFPKSRIYSKHVGAAPNRRTELYYATEDETGALQNIVPISAIKAWVKFNGTTGVVTDQYNVTGVTVNSAGNFTIAYGTALQNTKYAVNVTCSMNAAGTVGAIGGVISTATANCNILTRSLSAGSPVAVTTVHVIIMGN